MRKRNRSGIKRFINRVIVTLNWRLDVDDGEIIEQVKAGGLQYCKDHLSYHDKISQKDLNLICDIINDTFNKCNSKLTVRNSMGKILPDCRKI